MQDKDDTILYIGKARHLKKRMARYFFSQTKNSKTRALVAQIAQIFVTVTHTEGEALILENTLIKTHQPRYNILLRDDKSYPYIFLTTHTFPSLGLHRGAKAASGRYFGPYPHVGAVHETLKLLQKLFPIRQCQDSFYRNRSRPCLQYQIKRCSAPCVGLIDEAAYQEEVQHAVLFLEGKSQSVITTLVEKMEMAAQALAFEKAAKYRDQISHLKKIQAHQYVSTQGGDIDIIAAVCQGKLGCLQVLTVRDGRFIGNKAFFPKIPPNLHLSKEIDKIEQAKEGNKKDKKDKIEQTQIQILLSAFLPQYYLAESRYIPNEIILNCDINEMTLLTEVISQQRGRQIHIHSRVRGVRARWVEMAMENAKISLVQRQPNQYRERLAALSIILLMEKLPQRLECFDISHTQGEATIASCVVFDSDGARRRDYRRFNIENITPGDDYAAMRQVVRRRYHRLQKEKAQLPDIIFIDGGIGQVQIAQTVLNELQLAKIRLIGVAKGVDRNSLETLILPENETPLKLPKDSPALLLIQYIRDEAHRFAITAHRKKLAKKRRTSVLEEIKGIGTKRRQRLLSYFGGLQSLSRAGVPDLTAVPGISRQLAQKIYDFFSRQ